MKNSPKSLKQLLPDFLDYIEIEKGLAQRTQINYSRYLHQFILWLEKNKTPSLKPHELSDDIIWKYRLYLARQAYGGMLKKSSQNYYLIALRILLSYFAQKNINSLPSDKIQLAKDAKTSQTVKFLQLDEVERLLLAPDINTKEGLRDRAILETLFSTGLRVAELAALNRDLVYGKPDKDFLEINIMGKGNRTRTVYFSTRALEWLQKYVKVRTDMDSALFVHYKSRKSAESLRLSIRSIERTVKKYSVLAGIPLFTSPHTLRHSYATDLLTQGVDLRLVQEFLGHKNIATTQIYTHVTSKQLREVHRKFHSGGRIKNK